MNVVLKVRNLTKKFGARIAVDNISFDVYEGEIFGFLGPNGSGKTTTIRVITGLAKPTAGEVIICGYPVTSKFEKAISNVGGIIENPSVYNNLSGIENLKYYASLYKGITTERINRIVEIVGLSDRMKDKVKTYSLGMKQRMGIAQALLHRPRLLLLDEPTNGLDPNGVIEMRQFLINIAKQENIAILISSHVLAEMELICDTIGIINNGKLVSVKSVDQMKKGKTEQISAVVNFPNYAGKLISNKFKPASIKIVKNTLTIPMSQDKIPDLAQFLIESGIAIFSISPVVKTLEEAFLETVNKTAVHKELSFEAKLLGYNGDNPPPKNTTSSGGYNTNIKFN